MKFLITIVALAIAIAAAVILVDANRPASPGKDATQASGAFTVMQAADFDLDDYKGKVVVMDFWATWCGPCKAAMPGIQKIHERFAGRPVEVLGMNCWESGDPVGYMKSQGYTYGLVLKADDLAAQYKVRGIPTFVVIGMDGQPILQAVGASRENEEKLLAAVEGELRRAGL